MSAPVSAAVMAGGKSRRMGRDKAWLDLGDGRPIVRRVCDVMSEVADEVFLVANHERFITLGLRVVPDENLEAGVLAAIATGLKHATHDAVLVVACDMPFLDAAIWRLLIERSEGVDAVIPRVGNELEVLHALYRKSCLPAMERALEAGKRRVISFLDEVRVSEVAEPELRALDPTLRSFVNLNTPEEVAAHIPRA